VATRLKHLPDFKGLADRLSGIVTTADDRGQPRWTGEVRLLPHKLEQPLRWRKPRRIFVCDKGDLFHPKVPNEYIAAVFGVMAACPQHTFIVLTKRPERMVEWYRWVGALGVPAWAMCHNQLMRHIPGNWTVAGIMALKRAPLGDVWPLPIWLGVTCEDQPRADERISLLLQVPAAVWWVSYEPGLGALDLTRVEVERAHGTALLNAFTGEGRTHHGEPFDLHNQGGISWLVIGCESGPRARPFDLNWARSMTNQCEAAGVPCFTKQLPWASSIAGGGRPTLLKSAELAKQGWPVQYPEAR
jgi:protein gp37